MARSRGSIGFIPWVLGSITPEISYKLVIAKCSSGIIDNLTCHVEACVCKCISRSIVYDSASPWSIWHARLLCPWNSLGKNTGVGCHAPLQGIFLTQVSNPHACGSCLAGGFFTFEPPGTFPNFEAVFCFMSGSNCCFLTNIQVSQETGKMVCYSHFFKNFPQFIVIDTKALE